MPLPDEVVTHPLVLLSVVDHYNRVPKKKNRRVVGVLLGTGGGGKEKKLDITNSFAVPFEEVEGKPDIWYLDHNYLETMFHMYHRVQSKERIVGFYSTGPKIRENDLAVEALMRKYCPNTVMVIVDVRPGVSGIPTTAYGTVDEVEQDGKAIKKTFVHIPSTIGAEEAEEVGVEHLLRDINDASVSTLAQSVSNKMVALAGLKTRLEEIKSYLSAVLEKKLPPSPEIIYNIQVVINLLPNLNVEELVQSMYVKTNDMFMVMYVSSLIRSVIALHSLVNNKIKYSDDEEVKEKQQKIREAEEKKKAEIENKPKKDKFGRVIKKE